MDPKEVPGFIDTTLPIEEQLRQYRLNEILYGGSLVPADSELGRAILVGARIALAPQHDHSDIDYESHCEACKAESGGIRFVPGPKPQG